MREQLTKRNERRLSSIGSYLKEWRFTEGMTREQVSEELKIHHHTLRRIETGIGGYNIVHIFKLADYFGVSPEEVIGILEE
jgi:transcriptional regulator with XRE-family HTH domain